VNAKARDELRAQMIDFACQVVKTLTMKRSLASSKPFSSSKPVEGLLSETFALPWPVEIKKDVYPSATVSP
jgi:hypothetical protein